MGTKILRVTFSDGTRMYGLYSTVVDVADTDIVQTGNAEPSERAIRALTLQRSGSAASSNVEEEVVQCEVLHYGDVSPFTVWTSMAKRVGEIGELTGPTRGEQYCGDVAEIAQAMDLQYMATTPPAIQPHGRFRKYLQRFV